MEYLVTEKQYEKLQKVLEELAEFESRLIAMECLYTIDEVENWEEIYAEIDFTAFSDTLRELKYLVEDIGGQEMTES